MTRLAFAIAFLAVFGVVTYCAVLLIKNYFEKQSNNNQTKTKTKKVKL